MGSQNPQVTRVIIRCITCGNARWLITTTVDDELDDAAGARFLLECSASLLASSADLIATSRISPQCLHFFAVASTSSPQNGQFAVWGNAGGEYLGSKTAFVIGLAGMISARAGMSVLGFGLSALGAARGIVIGLPHFLHFAVRPAASSGAWRRDLHLGHSTGIMSLISSGGYCSGNSQGTLSA